MKKNEGFCLNCGCQIESNNGIIPGSVVTDGDKTIVKVVPGGVVYGKVLGYKCCDCWGKWDGVQVDNQRLNIDGAKERAAS